MDIKKNATLVEFISTDISLGHQDGEVVAKSVVRIQFGKLGIECPYDIYHDKFPFISQHGVFTVSGKAVCGDEPFDFEKGSNIAETRSQQKAYAIAERVLGLVLHEIVSIGDNIAKAMTNNANCYEKCKKHIVELDN